MSRPVARNRWRRLRWVVIFGTAVAFISGSLRAADHRFVFDLPAQQLASALETFSAVTGVVVLYDGNLALGRTSVEVKGELSSEVALQRLLRGSGLVARYTADEAIVIVPGAPEPAIARSPSAIARAALANRGRDEQSYFSLLQAGIGRALCSTARTRPGDYRLAMKFWIGPAGEVMHPVLLSSTSDPDRDAAILDAVAAASIGEPPPAGLAQPFTFVMLPRSSGIVNCAAEVKGRSHG
ncbi:TonB-dependent outer membrane receptor [Bradyrhizobium sp. 31Argb]|uniref:STN domain-containing protein n=1 Tax=Bradyrhizobium sp. 31Argb TaxID=3141247 RepID=UPI0010D0C665|nr:TonB-dependent outer membrane receptor [Bradyrhizobium sp. Leo170]